MNQNPNNYNPIQDSTVNTNHATPTGTLSVNGKIGKALSFDGIDDMINASPIDTAGDFTVSMMINPDSLAGSGHNARLLHINNDENLQVVLRENGKFVYGHSLSGIGTIQLPAVSEWTRVTVRNSDTTLSILYDGIVVSSQSVSIGNPAPAINTLRIGADITNSGSNGHYNGIIDEIQMIREAKSDNWLLTESNNQNNPELFYNIGVSENIPDNTPPTITAPENIITEATGEQTIVNIGTATATDDRDPNPTITNNAPTSFSIDTTFIIWTATDESGNQSTAIQTVTIVATIIPGEENIIVSDVKPCFLLENQSLVTKLKKCGFGDDFLVYSFTGFEWITGGNFTLAIASILILFSYVKYHKASYPIIIGVSMLPISYNFFPVEFLSFAFVMVALVLSVLCWHIFLRQTKEY